MTTSKFPVNVWSVGGMDFIAVGPDGGDPQQSIPVDIDGWRAGYMDYVGAVFEWTHLSDELIFVIEGTQTLTYEGIDFVSRPGDLILIRQGTHVTFAGTKDCRIAYANGFSAGAPAEPVLTWSGEYSAAGDSTQELLSTAVAGAGYMRLGAEEVRSDARGFEFIWVTEGRAALAVGDSCATLGSGDFGFVRPGTSYLLKAVGANARVAFYRNSNA